MLVVYLARTLGKWIHSGQVGLFLTLGQALLLRIAVTSPKYVDEEVIEDFFAVREKDICLPFSFFLCSH